MGTFQEINSYAFISELYQFLCFLKQDIRETETFMRELKVSK